MSTEEKQAKIEILDDFVERLENNKIKIGRESLTNILLLIREMKNELLN